MAARLVVGSGVSAADSNQLDAVAYRVGDRVDARYKGRPRYYPGRILVVEDVVDYFTVEYDDGRVEPKVHRMCLKPAAATTPSTIDNSNNSNNNHNNQESHKAAQDVSATATARDAIALKMVLVVLGIDGAGKTTLMSTLQGDLEKDHVPSAGFTSCTFQIERGTATFYDLGGGPAFRGVWNEYYADVSLPLLLYSIA